MHRSEYLLPQPTSPQAREPAMAFERAPGFDELRRCTWGTHVTVCGQPARFNQAGVIHGREIVIVLSGNNPVLAAHSRYCEAAGPGEFAYYFDYGRAGLAIGTPPGAPLLREQGLAWLRGGDIVLVNGGPATLLEIKPRADETWLSLRAAPEQEPHLTRLGADCVEDRKWGRAWRMAWEAGLQVRLVSARLPTFAEVARLRPGTPVTLGNDALPGKLQCTQVRDGTRQFVMVKAAPWLSVHQADSQPVPGAREWIYRIRFEEAGLRLGDDAAIAS